MAFGGTIKRRARIDTRRRRRINTRGPYPEEQAKLIGSKTSLGLRDYDYDRRPFCRKIAKEMREPDMTPVPRRVSGTLGRLYLPGRTIVASAVLGDEAFDDFFPARYAPEVVDGNVVWPEDEMPLFDGDPRK